MADGLAAYDEERTAERRRLAALAAAGVEGAMQSALSELVLRTHEPSVALQHWAAMGVPPGVEVARASSSAAIQAPLAVSSLLPLSASMGDGGGDAGGGARGGQLSLVHIAYGALL